MPAFHVEIRVGGDSAELSISAPPAAEAPAAMKDAHVDMPPSAVAVSPTVATSSAAISQPLPPAVREPLPADVLALVLQQMAPTDVVRARPVGQAWAEAASRAAVVTAVLPRAPAAQLRDGSQATRALLEHVRALTSAQRGRCRSRRLPHGAPLQGLTFSHDAQQLASCTVAGEVHLWGAKSGGRQRTFAAPPDGGPGASRHDQHGGTLAFGADDAALALVSEDRRVHRWEVGTGAPLGGIARYAHYRVGEVVSDDGAVLASVTGDHVTRLWDLASGAELRSLDGWSVVLAFAPGRQLLACGRFDHALELWDPSTGERRQRHQGHSGTLTAVTFTADGRTVASASDDHTLRLWDVASGAAGRVLGAPRPGRCTTLRFAPDGRILAASSGHNVALWDLTTGRRKQTLRGHRGGVHTLRFWPDGRTLVSAAYDATPRLWDVATGICIRELRGHRDGVCDLALTTDGHSLATASDDGTARLWTFAQPLPPRRPPLRAIVRRLLGTTDASTDAAP